MRVILILFCLFLVGWALPSAGGQDIYRDYRVGGVSALLRTGPSPDSEFIAVIPSGVTIKGSATVRGGYLRVSLPAWMDCWVHADLVSNNSVSVESAPLRIGPGPLYAVLVQMGRGQVLSIRGKVGDWLRVAPVAGTMVWVDLKDLSATGTRSADTLEPGARGADLDRLQSESLVATREQGRPAVYEGTLLYGRFHFGTAGSLPDGKDGERREERYHLPCRGG